MHEYGISVFPDLADETLTKRYIEEASSKGYERVFTSMILSDQNFDGAKKPDDPLFSGIISFCHEKGMKVICDLNAHVIDHFGDLDQSLRMLKEMGVFGVRIDGGLETDELICITKHPSGMILQINASDIRSDIPSHADICRQGLDLLKKNGDISRVEACFNYYPRRDTGNPLKMIKETAAMLKGYGIPVSAFISSVKVPSFLHKESRGIPTCESLRNSDPYVAAKILLFSGIDTIYFGDTLVPGEDLDKLKEACISDVTRVQFTYLDIVPEGLRKQIDQDLVHSNRIDEPEHVIRCCRTRGIRVKPFNTVPRPYGCLTIDNDRSAQYEGETQIVLKDLDAFSCADVIGMIDEEYLILLDHLRDGTREFVLREKRKC